MSGKLQDYRQKRDFARTPEPKGSPEGARRGERRFVIQKHDAHKLHYDFRLELDGVLKSWAVPKEPKMETGLRRLAVQTEDHPLDYGSFEGEIPEGQYGAGSVIIWDRGTWTAAGNPGKALGQGKLDFELQGERLNGRWSLVRFGQRDLKSAKKENWLLIKRSDPRHKRAGSSSSGRQVDPSTASGARKSPLPQDVTPQLAQLVDDVPSGEDWIHELKLDGYRLLCQVSRGRASLLTRRGNDWTDRFPVIAADAAGLNCKTALLDGEAVVFERDGRTSFQRLQGAIGEGDPAISYVIFDLLYLDGWDFRSTPLLERKALLQTFIGDGQGVIQYGEHVEGRGEEFYRQACQIGLEGIISKRASDVYHEQRTESWLKVKCLLRQEFVITGYTEPNGKRRGFGALLLGTRDEPDSPLRYAGKVGTGFDHATLLELTEILEGIKRRTPPMSGSIAPMSERSVHWVEPELVAEIAFTGWTYDGRLRHPSFQGIREDKPASDIVKEQAMTTKEAERVTKRVRLTNPDKVLFPDDGITKRDLAEYWKIVGKIAMPHIGDRPLSLVRCPDGIDGQCFYQKHIGAGTPDAIARIQVDDDGDPYGMVDSPQALRGLVQISAIELHCWGSRSSHLDKPDIVVFDVDPDEELGWPEVVDAAIEVRERLEALGLIPFAKVTGGKGVHVVVPVEPGPKWPAVKRFARQLAKEMATEQPDRYTDTMSKAKRVGKIFIDYLRNDRESTSIGAYSPRARAGAPVAMPVEWDELPGDSPPRFHLAEVEGHLKNRKRDPWKDFDKSRRSLTG